VQNGQPNKEMGCLIAVQKMINWVKPFILNCGNCNLKRIEALASAPVASETGSHMAARRNSV